jgi:hypothetical protein
MKQPPFTLPFEPVRRVRHGRPVEPHAEDEKLHQAVVALRHAGHVVYRAGADHKVDGRLLSTSQLYAVAVSKPSIALPAAPADVAPGRRRRLCKVSTQ